MDPTKVNPTAGYSVTCSCHKTFSTPAAYKNHENVCPSRTNDLAAILAEAKRSLRRKAAEITSDPPSEEVQANFSSPTGSGPGLLPAAGTVPSFPIPNLPSRPGKRPRTGQLPSRYRDMVLTEKRLRDTLPQPLAVASLTLPVPTLADDTTPVATDLQTSYATFIDTPCNAFGLYRRYQKLPAHDPERAVSLGSLSDIKQISSTPSYAPYPNSSAFKLGKWYWNGVQKSQNSFRLLVDIVGSEDFVPADVRNINWKKIDSQLGVNEWDSEEWENVDAGWHVSEVTIQVPFHRNVQSPGVRPFTVRSFHRRPLVLVIRDKLSLKMADMRHSHLEPYELMWRMGAQEEPIRLHGEIYTSPSFSKAHHELQSSPPEPGCALPRYVVSLMFWSDGTHLTNFGTASLTPLYLQFGNESKYRRCKPSSHLTEHVAYFEELPDEFKAFASQYIGKSKIDSDFLSHCRRELAHAQWRLLLDDEFVEAYHHGIVAKWEDGISRRFYPCIFCYSADYKE
ncbi:hypothetical protein DXG01_008981, partial [Tephrocybe rancida]